jgi:hypothetical protein
MWLGKLWWRKLVKSIAMDLGSAWEWCERAVAILACQEGTLEQRVRAAFREAFVHAKPHLCDSHLAEFRPIERILAEDRALSVQEAWSLARGILWVANQATFLYAVDEAAIRRWQEAEKPRWRPLPELPSAN